VSDERFRLRRELGTGTWGTVYEAEDRQEGGFVALKVLHPVWERHASAASALQRDIVRLRRIEHPNVARVHGLHTLAGRSALVQERVVGLDIGALLRRLRAEGGSLPQQAVMELVAHVASALQATHAEGVLHRGLKPGNLVLRADATCCVLDFGVARDEFDEAEAFTQSVRYGSLRYREPERRHGGVALPEGDVYALGCLAFELLALRPLGNADAVAERHQERVRAALAELAVSDAVRELIAAMVDHAPERRPPPSEVVARAEAIAHAIGDGGLGSVARRYVPEAARLFDEPTDVGIATRLYEPALESATVVLPPEPRRDWALWVTAIGLAVAGALILVPS